MFTIRSCIKKYFLFIHFTIKKSVSNLGQLYIVGISMVISSKLNDFDALKERFENNLPLSSLKKYFSEKVFLSCSQG